MKKDIARLKVLLQQLAKSGVVDKKKMQEIRAQFNKIEDRADDLQILARRAPTIIHIIDQMVKKLEVDEDKSTSTP